MKTILVVDDNASIRTLVRDYLSEQGFRVLTANNGQNALFVARQDKPDLILLDIMMPDKSGDDIAQELRDDPRLSSIPIVFLTALVTPDETGAKASKIGGNIFLAKPVSADELVAVIEETLSNGV